MGNGTILHTKDAKDAKLNMFTNTSILKQFFHKTSPFICAPMVHQSELTFRLLCRRYDVSLAATPMLNSKIFAAVKSYRNIEFQTHSNDQPLIAQLAASEPKQLLEATHHLHQRCDIIDLNFGCPQAIARRGNYGAFLLSDIPKMQSLVNCLAETYGARTPISCKIRILPTHAATLEVAHGLIEAGCQILTIHGRTRDQNKQKSGAANWSVIKKVISDLQDRYPNVVIISNGGVGNLKDAHDCMKYTKAHGVMAAEGLLCNPSMFYDVTKDDNYQIQSFLKYVLNKNQDPLLLHVSTSTTTNTNTNIINVLVELRQLSLAKEYLSLAHLHYQNYLKPVRSHLFKMCHVSLEKNNVVRGIFAKTKELSEMENGVDILLSDAQARGHEALKKQEEEYSSLMLKEILEWVMQHVKEEQENYFNKSIELYSAKISVAGVAIADAICEKYYETGEASGSNLWYYRHPRVYEKETKRL